MAQAASLRPEADRPVRPNVLNPPAAGQALLVCQAPFLGQALVVRQALRVGQALPLWGRLSSLRPTFLSALAP